MARTSKKSKLAAAQDPQAPYLFDDGLMPVRNDIVAMVAAGNHKHTGVRLMENEKLCQRVVDLLLQGIGVLRVARLVRVSPHSVRAVREALVTRGEMALYKERFVAKCADITELGADKYLEALDKDQVPAGQIPIGVGIFGTKRAEALSAVESGAGAGAAAPGKTISAVEIDSWMVSLNPAKPTPKDLASCGPKLLSEGKPPVPDAATPFATPSAPPTTPTEPTASPDGISPPTEGGGGMRGGPAPEGPTEPTQPNMPTKDL